MEIFLKNGDCEVETGISTDEESSRVVKEQRKSRPPRPPVTEFSYPSPTTSPGIWSSPPFFNRKNSEDFSEPNVLLFRKLPDTDHLGTSKRKTFLRPTEHILATFYGIIFIIHGNDWNVFKSEYLPIYFVRVSVKNINYPFRILVVDNDTERAVDFIVNCNTKTSISEQAVRWEDQETFGAKFSTKSQAVQFYDTISRMISTLKKGEELKNENSEKILELEVHLPDSQIKNYQFLRDDKLKDALTLICGKEHLQANDHYFHYMQLTDDSLDMNLRVGDIRTNVVRVVSKKDMRRSSTDILEKVSQSSAKKSGRIFSLFRRRLSRKRKNSKLYSSAPSVLQYTDNIFMVERQTEEQKKDENELRDNPSTQTVTYQPAQPPSSSKTTQINATSGSNLSVTTKPGRTVKRRAPQPPSSIDPIEEMRENPLSKEGIVVDGGHITDKKKLVKRRAPSPPKHPVKQEQPLQQIADDLDQTSQKAEASKGKPLRPPKPSSLSPSLSSCTSLHDLEAVNGVNQAPSIMEKKKALPVFIPPPPPLTTPPPLEECETPVGPVDIELGEDTVSVKLASQTNGPTGETKSFDSSITGTSGDQEILESRDTESAGKIPSTEEHSEGKLLTIEGNSESGTSMEAKLENVIENESINKVEDVEKTGNVGTNDVNKEKENKLQEEQTYKKDNTSEQKETNMEDVKQMDENETKENEKNEKKENLMNEELKFQEGKDNLNPETLQIPLNAQSSVGDQTQQFPFNFQNQQFFAIQQRQQILNSLLLQQMLEQQMASQTANSLLHMNMQPITGTFPPVQNVGGALAPPMQSASGVLRSVQSAGGAVPPMQSVGDTATAVQFVGGGVPPMQLVSGSASTHHVSGTSQNEHAVDGGVPLLTSIQEQVVGQTGSNFNSTTNEQQIKVSTVPHTVEQSKKPSEGATVDTNQSQPLKSASSKVEEPSEPIVEGTFRESGELISRVPPVKYEELVNRPLFKKMLAQISQEKAKGIPKPLTREEPGTKVGVTPFGSPSPKIDKVPPAYVESAEKNLPVTREEKEKKAPVSLKGGKSSYVDSAIGRDKADDLNTVHSKNEKNFARSSAEESYKEGKSLYVDSARNQNKLENLVPADVKDEEKMSLPTKVKEEKHISVVVSNGVEPLHVDNAANQHKPESSATSVPADVKAAQKITSPTKEEERRISVVLSGIGRRSLHVDSAAGQHKPDFLATKPKYQRHMSEPAYFTKPKPMIAPKPTLYAAGKSKSLPRPNKREPLQISLSLTPEERLMLPSFSGMRVTSNVKTAELEQKNIEVAKKVKERQGRVVHDSAAKVQKEDEVHVMKNNGEDVSHL